MSLVKSLLSISGGLVLRLVPFSQEKSPKAKGAVAGAFAGTADTESCPKLLHAVNDVPIQNIILLSIYQILINMFNFIYLDPKLSNAIFNLSTFTRSVPNRPSKGF